MQLLYDLLLPQSFNLKPATATRPSIQGPKTNLKVAAILEKANAIRQVLSLSLSLLFRVNIDGILMQACAGSDEDDDGSWSDS